LITLELCPTIKQKKTTHYTETDEDELLFYSLLYLAPIP